MSDLRPISDEQYAQFRSIIGDSAHSASETVAALVSANLPVVPLGVLEWARMLPPPEIFAPGQSLVADAVDSLGAAMTEALTSPVQKIVDDLADQQMMFSEMLSHSIPRNLLGDIASLSFPDGLIGNVSTATFPIADFGRLEAPVVAMSWTAPDATTATRSVGMTAKDALGEIADSFAQVQEEVAGLRLDVNALTKRASAGWKLTPGDAIAWAIGLPGLYFLFVEKGPEIHAWIVQLAPDQLQP